MLVFGIDKFMSECRALVNFCGNAVATLFIAHWDKSLDIDRARRVFRGDDVPPLHEIDEITTPVVADDGPRIPVGAGHAHATNGHAPAAMSS